MQKLIAILYLMFVCIVVAVAINRFSLTIPNVHLSTLDLIANDGYPVANHQVRTEDGYIINIQRIPGKLPSIPVLLMHGFCSDSHSWVLTGKNHSLPYLLADDGLDVWLGNVRGNSYGKMHANLSTSESEFWKFSVDEMGMYDLPEIISYIYKLTHQRVVYIGYSMGANVGLIMNAKRHDIDDKVRLMIHLGPPVFMNTAPIASFRLLRHFTHIKSVLELFRIYEWPPGYRFIKYVAKHGCNSNNLTMNICESILLSQFDFDRVQISHFTLKMLINHITDTTSTMVVNHFVQWIKSGHFQQYDYGIFSNIKKYNRILPCDYNMSDVRVPTTIFYTVSDNYASIKGIHQLYHLLPNKTGLFAINNDKFSHLHFEFGRNAHNLVYEKILNKIKEYC